MIICFFVFFIDYISEFEIWLQHLIEGMEIYFIYGGLGAVLAFLTVCQVNNVMEGALMGAFAGGDVSQQQTFCLVIKTVIPNKRKPGNLSTWPGSQRMNRRF